MLRGWEPVGVLCTLRLARALQPDLHRHTLDALLAARAFARAYRQS